MATLPLIATARTPVLRRDYLLCREPDMTEADALAGPAAGVVRTFGLEQRTVSLERIFSQRVGANFAVSAMSREASLQLALKALGLGAGDDVIVSALAPVTTANAVLMIGANPLLADVDAATQIITPETADLVRTLQTRAVIVTHLGGRAANMQTFESYARDAGLTLINDAGLGIDTQHAGRNISQFGAATVYGADTPRRGQPQSGGVIVTNSQVLAERLVALRNPAQSKDSPDAAEPVESGYRMSATQAAVGLRYLDRLDPLSRRRRSIWNRYDEALASLPLLRPSPVTAGDRHSLGLYSVLVGPDAIPGGRDEVALALHKMRIGTGVHYRGVHLHPRYRDSLGYVAADFPIATRISAQTLSLPLSANMTDRDVEDVIAALTDILESGSC
jgi:dTDP-4-amino-4,6-dideoxygalactose transaminase